MGGHLKERGILFTPENYTKVVRGEKTQTRRIIKPTQLGANGLWPDSPYGTAGDTLYVKEGLARDGVEIRYRRDKQLVTGRYLWEWQRDTLSPLHMPKWAARLWLTLATVRVERVQDIREGDAIAEGIELLEGTMNPHDYTGVWKNYDPSAPEPYWNNPIDSFHSLWKSIHGPGSWERNDWVWVLTFRREAQP